MTSSRPNIILILADDMGYGDLACINGGLSHTPVLDTLAGESLCCTQAYSASCVCAPARAGLLTGRYAQRTGCIDLDPVHGLSRLALRETTIADVFAANGYATGLVGKFHNGDMSDRRFHPNRRGIQGFFGFIGGTTDYCSPRLVEARCQVCPSQTPLHACGCRQQHEWSLLIARMDLPSFWRSVVDCRCLQIVRL